MANAIYRQETMMNNRKIIAAAVFGAAAVSFASTSAFAETQWEKDHPRRTEVNGRLANQNARIHNEVKSGQITKAQGAALHQNDKQIRGEERSMASQNGGHITKTEQKALNQQENANSKAIGK
jgi:hypothetical protein